jgi:curli biogenesis system outer membrane secretion channel CsgG
MKKTALLLSSFLLMLPVLSATAETEIPAPKGNLKYTIAVQKFNNEAGWRGRWDLGTGFTTIMTDILNSSGYFTVLAAPDMRKAAMREQDLGASGRVKKGKKTPKIGEMTPAQLFVRGSITHVQETSGGSGGIGFKGIRIGGSKGSAEINITIYIMDTTTGQVVASKKITGKSGKRGISLGYHGSALGGLTGDLSGFKKDNIGQACENAAGKAVKYLVQQLDGVDWEGTVMLVKGENVIINRGTREGVKEGEEFKIGKVDELRDPDTGELLDSVMTTVATVKATKVKEKISYCKPVSGGDKIEKGMSIMPASK